jgi:hypothetical protein
MAKVLNQLIYSRILLGTHHYLPRRTTSSASKNLMEKHYKNYRDRKMTEMNKKCLRC